MQIDENIYTNYQVTSDRAIKIAKYFNIDLNKIENVEICKYIDQIIDEKL